MNKSAFKISSLIKASLLIAIAVVLTRLISYSIPIGGLPTLRIGFGMIPIMISGILLGPALGFISGIAADLIGFFMAPGGSYIPGLTLTSGLYGLIPGLLLYTFKIQTIKFNFNIVNTGFIVLLAGYILSKLPVEEGIIMENIFVVFLVMFIATIYVLIPYAINFVIKKGEKNLSNYGFDKIAFTVSFTYLISATILNTFFLSQAFGSTFMAFLPGRILAGVAMIPLYSIVIYLLSRAINFDKEN